MLRSLYTLRLFLRKFHNFIDAWGERGLAYIINPPIPGKTCFELTARHKNRLLWRGWKSRKKIIFTSFLGQFPCDDTLSVDSHLHYSSCVCLLSVTPSFCFRQELVPAPTFRVFYFEIQLAWVLLPEFDVLSEQIVTSELLLRQCLSVSAFWEMTFAWACRPVRTSGARQCSGFLLPGSPLHPQYYSFQRRKESLGDVIWCSCVSLKCPLVYDDGHNEW